MYKIATLNKISPKGLARLSEKYSIVEDVNEANGILVRSQNMQSMEFSDNLLAIARAGAGVNNIPVDRCSEEGIVVFNTPGANANAVKELVLTGILLSARNIPNAIEWTKTLTDDVSKTVEKNKSQFAGSEIKGKTLGIIGLGAIGVMVANTAEALGMKVVGYDPYISVHSAHELSRTVKVYEMLDTILPECDYISIHVPFIEQTKELIRESSITLMKDNVCILNFSRDKIVNDNDIKEALKNGKIKKYVTDFPNDNLVGTDNVICIPHLGASTAESEENCAKMAVDEVMDYIENGNILNSVNFPNCSLGLCTDAARICILNKNVPTMLSKITGILADMNINISDLLNKSKNDLAYTLVDVDSPVDEKQLKEALSVDGIISVRVIS
ncbi:3-phosphoglycerate dehydrogenase family protein [Anaerovorax odorimutans]|uniref:3-phosphoglycerate dehydrogenase family protein n=1 Tax=Anaerovorax odorimutans TaxID=109327 RepID=UPI0004244325|nr:3-phosphoglycerate dehydrogenase family protein [Anaerovorax odorimutans]